MKTKTYERTYGTFIVEECTRKEFVELATWAIDGIIECEDEDTTIYVLYKDGREFFCSLEGGSEGKFMKSNIAFGVIDNPATYQTFGSYVLDDNGVIDAT